MILSSCGDDKSTVGSSKPPTEVSQKPSPQKEQGQKEAPTPDKPTGNENEKTLSSNKVLLVTQSVFKQDDKGLFTIPDRAMTLILKPNGERWEASQFDDTESNVFHKALQYEKQGILTLGGNEALLKLWNVKNGKWQAKTLWHPKFGGKHNRLRDFEIADFNGDGQKDLAIATHDQGVVAVVWRRGDKWEPEELDRSPNTFVHEIEVGDLDKDGKLEIYATPSKPNTVSGEDQGGKVVRFSWNGKGFTKSDIVVLETRHVKEIMVADADGDGQEELYAALEAEMEQGSIKTPVEIRRYDSKDGKIVESPVTTIDDRFCRFLVNGDLDQDGKKEIVAAAFSSGVWLIEREGDTYTKKCIYSNSQGFEHAAYITDLNGDGEKSLYVADDRGGVIRRFHYLVGSYQPKVIHRRASPGQAMVWNITDAEL
jgi:hypothetical protein